MLSGYHHLSRQEQLDYISKISDLDLNDLKQLTFDSTNNHIIENYLTDFVIPEGVSVNLKVNGKEYITPMVTEEPSVVAAASNAAKIFQTHGKLTAVAKRQMMGQILLQSNQKLDLLIKDLLDNQAIILKVANNASSSLFKRGGGANSLRARILDDEKLSLDIFVDTKDAMGANAINTMMEAVAGWIKNHLDIQLDMAILSNLSDQATARVNASLPVSVLGDDLSNKITLASEYAQLDPYRAATHNKGIMNGVDAVVIAVGNDWRAIQSGAHAYASRSGKYQGLSTWKIVDDQLIGELEMPMQVATIGGSINVNKLAQLNLAILKIDNAIELAEVIVSVGLMQNFAALKALVSDGIQKGHMKMHARTLLMNHGLAKNKIQEGVDLLIQEAVINSENAKKIIDLINDGY